MTETAKYQLLLHRLEQSSQLYGTEDENMFGRVFFDLAVGATIHRDLSAVVKQAAGSTFEKHPIEVLPPDGYSGELNYEAFRNCVERYCRSLIGSTGTGIRLENTTNVHMSGNTFVKRHLCTFD